MLLVPIAPPEFDVDLEIAYATADNFTGAPVYARAACYLHPEAAECLERAIAIAREDPDPKMRRIAAIVLPDLVTHHPEQRDRVDQTLATLRDAEDIPLQRAARAAGQRLTDMRRTEKNQE